MKRLVLYTAIFGRPRRFNFPKVSTLDIDRICYTDLNVKEGCHQMMLGKRSKTFLNDFYEIKKMRLPHLAPMKANRFVKICIPDELFDNYEYSIYSDAKHPFTFDFDHMLGCLEPGSDFLIRKHRSKRDCAYDEGLYCIERRKDTEANIMRLLNFYKHENFPAHNGLYDAGWILRRHTKALRQYMKLWWEFVYSYSERDQISLPYLIWKYGMEVSLWKRAE